MYSKILFSLKHLWAQGEISTRRFPATVVACISVFVLFVFEVHSVFRPDFNPYYLVFSAMLMISLSIALHLFAEARQMARRAAWLILGITVALAATIAVTWMTQPTEKNIIHFAQLFVTFHLFASLSLPSRDSSVPRFWTFNRKIFQRVLASGIFSFTLALGCIFALLMLKELFAIPINDAAQRDVWLFFGLVFSTIFFLVGVPTRRDLDEAEGEPFPRLLRLFCLYVLFPLLAVYLLVLFAYLVKILLAWELPKVTVGWLVVGASGLGIFTLLLADPLTREPQSQGLRKGARIFYAAILPLLVLMEVGLWARLQNYGVTESRYVLGLLGLWLFVLSVTFLIRKTQDIRWIPVSLALLTLATSFGPWSASSVALRSQKMRLRSFLEHHLMLPSATSPMQKPAGVLTFVERRELSSLLDYLLVRHGTESISEWISPTLATENRTDERSWAYFFFHRQPTISAPAVMKQLDLTYVGKHEQDTESGPEFAFYRDQASHSSLIAVDGYQYILPAFYLGSEMDAGILEDTLGLTFKVNRVGGEVKFRILKGDKDLIHIDLVQVARDLRERAKGNPAGTGPLRDEEWVFVAENKAAALKLGVQQMSGSLQPGAEAVTSFLLTSVRN